MASPYKVLATGAAFKESGVADHILISRVADFTTIGCPGADGVLVADDHVFAVGAGWVRIECSPSTNQLKAALIGEPGSLKVNAKLDIFVPGSKVDLHKLIYKLKNEPHIILVKDADCVTGHQYYQLGCDCLSAYLVAGEGFATGTTKDGKKGYMLSFEAPAGAVQIYDGAITMHP